MRRTLSGIALAALLAGPVAAQRPTAMPKGFAECARGTLGDAAWCGTVDVPETPGRPDGRRIGLNVVVLRAAEAAATGVIAVLVGGPGQAATDFTTRYAAPDGLRRTHDILLVDQRGTGSSNPLTCAEVAAPAPSEQLIEMFPAAFLDRCRAALERRADLVRYTTREAAIDLLAVQERLGYGPLDLLASSYGTRLAMHLARTAPAKIRTMTLVGLAPLDMYIPRDAAADVDLAMARLDSLCRSEAACARTYPDVTAAAREVAARLDAGRTMVALPREGGTAAGAFGRGPLAYALRGLLYDATAGEVPERLAAARGAGSLDGLAGYYLDRVAWITGRYATGMYLSVICHEDVPAIDMAKARAASSRTLMGSWMLDQYRAACAHWPALPHDPAFSARGVTVRVPTLVLSGSRDPVTPPRYADEVLRDFPTSHHLVFAGFGHGIPGRCANDYVKRFMAEPAKHPGAPVCEGGEAAVTFTGVK